MSSDDVEFAAVLARAITDKVKAEYPTSKLVPARVLDYGTDPGIKGVYARVHVVGDPPDRSLQVPVLVSSPLSKGDMVMVMFDPPEGAYVWSLAQPATVNCGRLSLGCLAGGSA